MLARFPVVSLPLSFAFFLFLIFPTSLSLSAKGSISRPRPGGELGSEKFTCREWLLLEGRFPIDVLSIPAKLLAVSQCAPPPPVVAGKVELFKRASEDDQLEAMASALVSALIAPKTLSSTSATTFPRAEGPQDHALKHQFPPQVLRLRRYPRLISKSLGPRNPIE